MMTREEIIREIEGLYPPDETDIGVRLLEQAKRELKDWRTEPTEVLYRLMEICRNEEERSTK